MSWPNGGSNEMTIGERYARVAIEIIERGSITSNRVCEIADVRSRRGACYILNILARRVLPLVYDHADGRWYRVNEF